MFDIGFWELLIIGVVLLLVMGPERLPEVAKQAAFLVRKARQSMYRLRSEMRTELDDTPFNDLAEARREMADLKNDFKQMGRDLADAHEEDMQPTDSVRQQPIDENTDNDKCSDVEEKATKKSAKKKTKKKVSKKKVAKKTS